MPRSPRQTIYKTKLKSQVEVAPDDTKTYGVCPPCTTQAVFNEWHALNAKSPREDGGHAEIGFCMDCTKSFQDKAKREGVCTNPYVVFVRGLDGCIKGWKDPLTAEERAKRETVRKKNGQKQSRFSKFAEIAKKAGEKQVSA